MTDSTSQWTAPAVQRHEGSLLDPEPALLRGLLDWHRATMLQKCAGLTGEELARTPIEPSNLSLLGLIRHAAKVERIWFRRRLRGEQLENLYSTPERPDADFEDLDPASAEADYGRLLSEQQQARDAVDGVALDHVIDLPGGDKFPVRLLFIHMIGEYARHNGHADLIRQRVDGVTGA